jgi:predicted secreted protein
MIRLNELFGKVGRIASAFAIFGLLVIASCSKDEEGAVKVASVEFTNEAQTVAENGAPVTINIPFSRAAGKDGTITISVTEGAATEYGTHFTTTPNGASGTFELAVTKGQTSAQFTFSPQNNGLLADDKTVVLAIEDVSSGFEIGTKDSNTITITDDEGPTQVNFAVAASSTAEDLEDGSRGWY